MADTPGQELDERAFLDWLNTYWKELMPFATGTLLDPHYRSIERERLRRSFMAGKAYGLELRGCCEEPDE